MVTRDKPQGIVGFNFAQALLTHDYEAARAMLSPELQTEYPVEGLRRQFEEMMTLANEPPPDFAEIEVLDNGKLGQERLDAEGWAYVAIWSEAVTVTVKPFGAGHLITSLIWGRP